MRFRRKRRLFRVSSLRPAIVAKLGRSQTEHESRSVHFSLDKIFLTFVTSEMMRRTAMAIEKGQRPEAGSKGRRLNQTNDVVRSQP